MLCCKLCGFKVPKFEKVNGVMTDGWARIKAHTDEHHAAGLQRGLVESCPWGGVVFRESQTEPGEDESVAWFNPETNRIHAMEYEGETYCDSVGFRPNSALPEDVADFDAFIEHALEETNPQWEATLDNQIQKTYL